MYRFCLSHNTVHFWFGQSAVWPSCGGKPSRYEKVFDELEDDDLISIEFPITLKKYDGTEVVVDNNSELAAALEMAKTNVMKMTMMIIMMMISPKRNSMSTWWRVHYRLDKLFVMKLITRNSTLNT